MCSTDQHAGPLNGTNQNRNKGKKFARFLERRKLREGNYEKRKQGFQAAKSEQAHGGVLRPIRRGKFAYHAIKRTGKRRQGWGKGPVGYHYASRGSRER